MTNEFKRSKTSILTSIILVVFVSLIGLTGCSQETNDDSNSHGISTEPKQNIMEPVGQTEETYYGEWIINQVQAYGIGTYSVEDAESLFGENLRFTADEASYFGDQLSDVEKLAMNPIYTETVISESDFVENYRIPFDNLGIEADSISEINVSDSNGSVSTFFIKDDNTLIIYGGGTYFELVRKN